MRLPLFKSFCSDADDTEDIDEDESDEDEDDDDEVEEEDIDDSDDDTDDLINNEKVQYRFFHRIHRNLLKSRISRAKFRKKRIIK